MLMEILVETQNGRKTETENKRGESSSDTGEAVTMESNESGVVNKRVAVCGSLLLRKCQFVMYESESSLGDAFTLTKTPPLLRNPGSIQKFARLAHKQWIATSEIVPIRWDASTTKSALNLSANAIAELALASMLYTYFLFLSYLRLCLSLSSFSLCFHRRL